MGCNFRAQKLAGAVAPQVQWEQVRLVPSWRSAWQSANEIGPHRAQIAAN
jgi:hypothetical protein